MKNVIELLENKGIVAKRVASTHGGEYHSPCPGCGGNKRFHVWPQQKDGHGGYWCRDCAKTGDSIQFLIGFDGLTFPDACRQLDHEIENTKCRPPIPPAAPGSRLSAGAESPLSSYGTQENKLSKSDPDLWAEKAGVFVEWANSNLLTNSKMKKWLKARGIDKAAIGTHPVLLGYNPGDQDGRDIFRHRSSWGLVDEIKKDGRKKRLWLPKGLVIPKVKNGRVVRIRFRRFSDDPPPYYILQGSDMSPLVINPNTRAFVIIESELDAIAVASAASDLAGVVALGSAQAKPGEDLIRILRRAACILVALDYDSAGKKARWFWKNTFPNAKRWSPFLGKDPGESYKAGVDLRSWVIAGLPAAWNPGRSRSVLSNKEGGAISPEEKSVVKGSPGIPAGVQELADLLKKHPVSIFSTANRLQIRESARWAGQNWEISKRISHLVYFEPEVMAYLNEHPEENITGKNILNDNG